MSLSTAIRSTLEDGSWVVRPLSQRLQHSLSQKVGVSVGELNLTELSFAYYRRVHRQDVRFQTVNKGLSSSWVLDRSLILKEVEMG